MDEREARLGLPRNDPRRPVVVDAGERGAYGDRARRMCRLSPHSCPADARSRTETSDGSGRGRQPDRAAWSITRPRTVATATSSRGRRTRPPTPRSEARTPGTQEHGQVRRRGEEPDPSKVGSPGGNSNTHLGLTTARSIPHPRTSSDRRRARGAGGAGEPALRGTSRSRASCSTSVTGCVPRRSADSEASPDLTGAGPPHRHQLAAVPAHSGHEHAGRRHLPRRLRGNPAAALRPVRTRCRRPLPARPWRDQTSERVLDDAAGPQPPYKPRRPCRSATRK